MLKAEFEIKTITDDLIYIVDTGHNHTMTVTNNAEAVIDYLHKKYNLQNRIVYYLDSYNNVDIINHENGKFTGFKPFLHQNVNLEGLDRY